MKKIIVLELLFIIGLYFVACSNQTTPPPYGDAVETSPDIPADTKARFPVVEVIEPASNKIIEGIIHIKLKAYDPSGKKIKQVKIAVYDPAVMKILQVAEAVKKGDFYEADIDTTKKGAAAISDGPKVLAIKAVTEDNRVGKAQIVIVVDNNPPQIGMAQPLPNGNFTGNLVIIFKVTDNHGSGIKYVTVRVEGKIIYSKKEIPDNKVITIKVPPGDWKPGQITIEIIAEDRLGHKNSLKFQVHYVEKPTFATGKYVSYGKEGITSMCRISDPKEYDRLITISEQGLRVWDWNKDANTLISIQQVSDARGKIVKCVDLNADGYTDVVVVDPAGNTTNFSFYLQDSKGNIRKSYALSVAYPYSDVAFGDLSGDNLPEMVMLSSLVGKELTVVTNTGKGTFDPKYRTFSGTKGGNHIVISDFSGDGNNDVLVTRPQGGLVTLFPGTGNGTFSIGLNSSLDIKNISAVVAGKVVPGEAISAALMSDAAHSKVYLVTKQSLSDYSVAISDVFSTALSPKLLDVRDINNDGIVDLAALCEESNLVAVFLGDKNSKKYVPVHWYEAGGGGPAAINIADINHDGYRDIVVLNAIAHRFTLLLFDKAKYNPDDIYTASFMAPQQLYLPYEVKDLVLGHFMSTTSIDLAVLGTLEQGDNSRDNVLIYKGKNGVFNQSYIEAQAFVEKRTYLNVADFDRDGLDDIVVAGKSENTDRSLYILYSKGQGGFVAQPIAAYKDPYMVAVANIAAPGVGQDKYPDLAVLSSVQSADKKWVQKISIFVNKQDGTFQQLVGARYKVPQDSNTTDLLLAPLSNSTYPDMFIANDTDVVYYPTSGIGGYFEETKMKRLAMGQGLISLYLGLLSDGFDESPDLVALAAKEKNINISYDMASTQLFNPPVSMPYPGKDPVQMVVADVNLDHFPDILVLDKTDDVVRVFMNLGSQKFSAPYSYPVGHGPIRMRVADINKAGCNDIVTLDKEGHTVTVLLNQLCNKVH